MRLKLGRAALLTVAFAVLAGSLVGWALARDRPDGRPDGDFAVFVVGPTALLHNGTVAVDQADALRALLALAQRDGFEVVVDDLAGCTYDYVRAIAGHGETATGGWNYYLRPPGGDWQWQNRAASCRGLHAGDDVLWCWVEPDERCAVYP